MVRVNGAGAVPAHRDRALVRMLGGVLIGAALVLTGCVSTSSDDGSSGGASCDGTCADVYTGYGIIETIRVLYNTHVYPGTGGFNTTENCSLGGTVAITGSVAGGEPTTLDLNWSMLSCAYSDGDSFDLVFTGAVDEDGTINNTTNITTLQYISSSLTISGEAYGDTVNETCAVNISRSDTGVTGTICERSFSY